MEINQYFIIFSSFIFISSVYLLRNPVYCILSFVAVVGHAVFLLVVLEVEYLAYILAIVYIGAIVVLFLFVVMMFYIRQGPHLGIPLYVVLQALLIGALVSYFYSTLSFDHTLAYTDYINIVYSSNDFTFLIAYYLFDQLPFLTIIAAILMLVGIMGAIALTLKVTPVSNLGVIKLRKKIWPSLRFKRPWQGHILDMRPHDMYRPRYFKRPALPQYRRWSCTPTGPDQWGTMDPRLIW